MFFRVPLDRVVSIDNRFQLAANIPIEKIGHCPKLVEMINPIVLDFRYDIGLNFYMSLTSLVLTAICSFVLLLPKFGIVFCCGHVGKNRNQDKLQDTKNDSSIYPNVPPPGEVKDIPGFTRAINPKLYQDFIPPPSAPMSGIATDGTRKTFG